MSRRRSWLFVAVVLLLALLAFWMGRRDGARSVVASDAPAAVRPTAPPGADPPLRPSPPPTDARPTAQTPTVLDDEARAAVLRDDPGTVAVCVLEPAVPAGTAHLIDGDDGDPPYDGRLLPVAAGEAFVGLVEPEGHGWLAVDGFEPVAVSWADGRCSPEPVVLPEGTAWISGHVRNAEGEPEGKVFVEGCGTQARTDADGTYAMAVRPEPCVLGAFRRDGLLFSAAEPVDLAPRAGGELVVDFALPELPKAGLGIVIEAIEEGIRIRDVLPGTAAFDAGLQSGDVVVEVDGTATAGLQLPAFIDLAVGDVGTEVEVVIRRGDSEERWLLDRRVLEEQPG